jgi:outer membrane receptor for ferric coprogen and ferric-rhodotorulic acid
MIMKKNYKLLWLLLPCAVIPFQGAFAQDADDEEIIELSPFVVTGNDDIGYQATSTLAGTRLRTSLRDIGSSISIVNEELLTDTASTNLEDVLIFTPNTEVGGLGGNFSGSQGASPIPEQQRDNPSGGITRIRGLAGADLTRDYFLTDVPFDTFNTDRIDVQRGANSALFGLGSPGGIVNATTIRADFLGNRGRLRFETDQYGTQRYSMRYNQMVGDVVAIRVAALSEDKEYEQRQAFMDDERIFVTATAKLPFGLQARASAEFAERHSANPDYVPPNDGITPWINLGKPIVEDPAYGGSLFRDTGTFFPGVGNSSVMTLALPGLSSGHATFYHDPSNPDPTYGGPAFIRRDEGLPNPYSGPGEWMMLMPFPEEQIIRRTGFRSDGTPVATGQSGFFSNGFVAQQITDRSIYDYRKNLFNGGTAQQGADWEVYNASIDGNYFDNRLGFEVAYYEQKFDSRGNNSVQGIAQRTIYIDPNRYLLNTTDGTADGPLVPNPSFGRPVMGGAAGGNDLTNDRDGFRIQVYGEVRFEDFMNEDSWLTKLLGRLTLTGLMDENSTFNKQAYSRGDRIDSDALARAIGGGDVTGYVWPAERSGQQFVLPVANNVDFLSINSLSDLAGAGIKGISHGRSRSHLQGNLYNTYTGWDQHNAQFTTFDAEVRTLWDDESNYPAAFFASKRLTEVESEVLVAQSYLWDDTIVLTGTWRNDKSSTASVSAATVPGRNDVDNTLAESYVRGPRSGDLVETYDDDTTSWSVVVHTPDFIREKLPSGLNLSFHYADSDNFVPSGSNVNIYNELVAAQSGNTEEKGFTIGAFDGKLTARFNWFETTSANNRFENGAVSAPAGILVNLAQQLDNPANVAQGFTAADAQAVLPPQGVIDVSGFQVDWNNPEAATNDRNSSDTGTQDFSAEGMEIEIAYNPTPKWTILATIARQETVKSNTFPVMQDFMNSFVIPNWVNSSFAQNYFINDDATQTLADLAQTAIVDNVTRGALEDGSPSIEQSEWRFALNTSYNIGKLDDAKFLKYLGDITVGGGIRWQDEAGIGFGVSQNQLGDYALDVNKPFWGDATTFIDVFARFNWELANDREFALQINIKDLTDNDGLQPYVANPDGSKLYRILEGRLITASATFTF